MATYTGINCQGQNLSPYMGTDTDSQLPKKEDQEPISPKGSMGGRARTRVVGYMEQNHRVRVAYDAQDRPSEVLLPNTTIGNAFASLMTSQAVREGHWLKVPITGALIAWLKAVHKLIGALLTILSDEEPEQEPEPDPEYRARRRALVMFGVRGVMLEQLAADKELSVSYITNWIREIQRMAVSNPAGVLVNVLRNREPAPVPVDWI